jgi:hypothetical protein
MAPEYHLRRFSIAFLFTALASLAAAPPPAHALRVVDYNVTNYPNVLFPQRQPYFRAVLAPLNADVVVCQEFTSQAGVDSFRANVLNANEPSQWASASFFNGNDTDNALFYKPARVQVLGAWAFYPNPANLLRYVTVWRLKPIGYVSGQAEFRIYSQHLKASTGFESQRLAEATGIRDSMNAMPAGTHGIVLGDFNFYKSSTETAYWKLQEVQTNNTGRVYDPLNPGAVTQDWHDNPAFASVFSQCPCVTCPAGSGFSGGGLDDRFDQILPTLNFNDGGGLDLVPGSYVTVGQDGQHWNLNITDPPTIPEGAAYANALWNASDHLPLRVDLQLPAKITADASLAFGTVIVGASASQNLSVSNPAVPPADILDYSLSAPAGFGAPGGAFTLAAGAPAATHAITMSTASAGNPSGSLSIASDDPDHPTTLVGLSGTVLDHAVASLDSVVVSLSDSLDFGDHETGQFPTMLARVHNRGYNPLQARLAVTSGVVTGGAGHFSIVGGFSPATVEGTAQSYPVAFDDVGTVQDSTYYATLTFGSADEALPGATGQPNLVLTLRARTTSGNVAVGDRRELPSATRFYAPVPNPLVGSSTLRFDLARAADVKLEIFDVAGRRVDLVAQGAFDPGRYSFRWDGRGADGAALGAGLYFVRFSGTGLKAQTARLAVIR